MKIVNPLTSVTPATTYFTKHPFAVIAVAALQVLNVLGLLIEIGLHRQSVIFDLFVLVMTLISAVMIALTVVEL